MTEAKARSLSVIANEIRKDWKNPYYGAVPYIDALSQLDNIRQHYGADPADSIVLYFLSNASRWKGDTARRVKAELTSMVKAHDKAIQKLEVEARKLDKRSADRVDGYDRDDLGESPDY